MRVGILIDYNFLILNNVSNTMIATMLNLIQFAALGFGSTVFP